LTHDQNARRSHRPHEGLRQSSKNRKNAFTSKDATPWLRTYTKG
jgi:hypothetical protein